MSKLERLSYLSDTPQYFNYLSESDKCGYNSLRCMLAKPDRRNRRNQSCESFSEMLQMIKSYIIRNDGHDWTRAIVCGIVWLTYFIMVNTRQLRILLGKCKSSINGSFQSLGYLPAVPNVNDTSNFINTFSLLKDNFSELRTWTFRSLPTYPYTSSKRVSSHLPFCDSDQPNCLFKTSKKESKKTQTNLQNQLGEDQKHKIEEQEKLEEKTESFDIFSDPYNFLPWEPQKLGSEPDPNENFDFNFI